jgi:hypothetical protein
MVPELLAHRAVFDCSLPLAAMFARLPPSSSEMTERKALLRHLLLQISGANIENPPASSTLADESMPARSSSSSARRRAVTDAPIFVLERCRQRR